MINDTLAAALGAAAGDVITVEVLEGRRPVRTVRVTAVVREYMDLSAYMRLDAVNRLMRPSARFRRPRVEQAIRIDARNDREAASAAGLRDGDAVIVHPSDKIAAGTRVAVR